MMNQKRQPPYILSIDAGTEAIKAGLFDLQGNRVAIGARNYPTFFPASGWAEQDPADWWSGLVGAVQDCLHNAHVAPEEIAGLSADATTCTLMPLDAAGQELGRALLWMDVRAAAQARRIFTTGDPALRYCLAGANAEWMPPKLLWLKENEPERYAATAFLLEFTDWIAWRLTGRLMLNLNTVTQRWFYHTPSGGWPLDFFAAIGLAGLADKFPADILPLGAVVGELSADAARALGLRPGIPVAAGGGDAFVGLLGQGVTQPGDLGVVMGSSNVLSALAAEEMHFPGVFGSFPDAIIPGLNLVEGGQASTGSLLSWFKRNFGADAEAAAIARNISVYRLLDEEAAQVPPGAAGLIVLDYFQGNRTPHTDSAARGAIWGLSLQSGRAQIFRALMEGIAYGMEDILQTFRGHGFVVERIIASGGATHSPLFMQIYADVVGQPLSITREPEASLLGSAIVAAVGAGLYPDLQTAARQMVSIERAYIPDAHRHDEYAFFVRQYQDTYQQLRELMRRMNERSSKK
ncbi:FGGY-family carbohydrate kinase [Caldilinea sp.]|uniref:FGGY-family carbohydrate kinase n=1 Tax=Caldilinea sp. TaxID=2293560 RepID=UPI002CCD4580|nr:FGGY-family carbohydrate kinase [Caldilinea sp.]